MSEFITEAFRRQYSDNFILLMQQKETKLEKTCVVKSGVSGKAKAFDRIGAVTARLRSSRHSDTYNVSTPHSRRWANLNPYDIGDLIDQPDVVRSLLDPTSSYLQNQVAALNRAKDTAIIAALEGSATAGEEAATTVALPADQKIATGSVGMTVEKVIQAFEKLLTAEADPDEPRFLIYGPQQNTNMLSEIEVISRDYGRPVLEDGYIKSWMGFTWILSNRLTKSSTTRYCYAYIGSRAVGLAVGSEVKTRVAERADKSFSTQVYAAMDLGAVRIEDEAVIQIACTEV